MATGWLEMAVSIVLVQETEKHKIKRAGERQTREVMHLL
jgi:hypothetical protein